MTDTELIRRYCEWSEEVYSAGFMTPFPSIVADFIKWLDSQKDEPPTHKYELDFLAEYKRQRGR